MPEDTLKSLPKVVSILNAFSTSRRSLSLAEISAATKEVRDTAVDVALSATRALLRDQVGSGRSAALVDEAIAELPRRLH